MIGNALAQRSLQAVRSMLARRCRSQSHIRVAKSRPSIQTLDLARVVPSFPFDEEDKHRSFWLTGGFYIETRHH